MKRYKLTTFVPVKYVERVLSALGDAGAGKTSFSENLSTIFTAWFLDESGKECT